MPTDLVDESILAQRRKLVRSSANDAVTQSIKLKGASTEEDFLQGSL